MQNMSAPGGPKDNTTAPVWELVRFDVHCARCGQDLRGLTEAKCPACALEFDWADAVPLEKLTCLHCGYLLYGLDTPRCPECGNAFTWEAVLDDYRRRQKPLFEYRWRKEPLRSLISTWWLAIRPWKLWREIDIHDPPAAGGLILLLFIALAASIIVVPVVAYAANWLIAEIQVVTWPPALVGARPRFGFAAAEGYFGYRYTGGLIAPWAGVWDWYGSWLASLGGGLVGGFGSLLLLRQSMTACKVRIRHVARVYVYMLLPLATGIVAFCFFVTVYDVGLTLTPLYRAGGWRPYGMWNLETLGRELSMGLALFTWLAMVTSIAVGYRRYIRMKHAWLVAILTQAIAVMFMLCIDFVPFWLRGGL